MNKAFFSSFIGVVAIFIVLVAANLLLGQFKQRWDLTQEKAYTLSPGTREILAKLDTPVQIRFYATQDDNEVPVILKTYAQRVEDLLGEFKRASRFVEITRLDPQPDSDAEDSANLDGVEGQPLQSGEKIYLGLSVSLLDSKEAIPFLTPTRERLLEYDIARAISRVANPKKPVVGLLTTLPVAGSGQPNFLMMQNQQRPAPPWAFYSELQRDFTIKTIETTADSIPEDVQVLVLIHPQNLTDPTLYAIDQFVLRGGRLVAFLDAVNVLDPQNRGFGATSSSNLEKLLTAWGIAFDSSKVVADLNYTAETRQGRMPALLALNQTALSPDDILTADIDTLVVPLAGAFSGKPGEGLQQTVLIHSSKNARLVDAGMAQLSGEEIIKNFVPDQTEHAIAIRLEGRFKSAFPNGKPGSEEDKEAAPSTPGLKESMAATSVVLVGDVDFLQDPFSVQEIQNPFNGARMLMPTNGNLSFAQSVVEQFAGDNSLIAVRSRAVRERPFTVVRELEAKAEAAFQDKISELETSLSEAQNRLSELQQTKDNGQKFILSSEQQAELTNFRKKELEVKKELKLVRRNLRSEIDSLETRLKWINIALVPAFVTITGIGIALYRRKRVAAK